MGYIGVVCVAIATFCIALPAGGDELVRNPQFAPNEDGDRPAGWSFAPYGTGAEMLYEAEGGHEGGAMVGVRTYTADARGSWLQVIPLADRGPLHVTGYYRTEGIESQEAAMLRLTWRRADRDNIVIGGFRVWLPPAEDWTPFELLVAPPDEAIAATVDLFNYFRPGTVWWSETRATSALTSGDERVRTWGQQVALIEAPPATDGSNLLPNPGFELDIAQPGTPDFWERGGNDGEGYPVSAIAIDEDRVAWAWQTDRARSGERSVSVTCHDDQARAAWVTRISLKPGPWRLQAWYMTEGMDPEPRQGPVARVTALDEDDRVILHYYAFGTASENDWSQLTHDFDAPPGTVAANVQLRNAWAAGTVHWDDAHLGANVERRAELEIERAENQRLIGEAAEILARTREQVEQTTEGLDGTSGNLLAAVLQWGLQDAELAIEAGMGRDAHATLTDLLDYCERAEQIVGQMELAQADPGRDGNPYIANLNDAMEGMAAPRPPYSKSYEDIEGAWTIRGIGANAHVLAWGLLDPRSDLMHDPRLLTRALVHLQAMVDHQIGGSVTPYRDSRDWNIDRFALAPTLDALLMIEEQMPWAILPSKRAAWWQSFEQMVEYQHDTYGFRWYEHGPMQPRIYPNMDVHYLLLMELGHRLFGDDRYAVERDRFVHFMDEGLLPMGAWTYTRMQNEVYQYHRHNTLLMARYYEISGDERARDILYRSRPYYPLVHNPEGMVEHYTDVSWKHSWVAASPGGAEVKAGMFDCAENKLAALNAARGGYEGGITAVLAAPWWKDIEPAAQRDEWIIFDENTLGPRGQFGRFSFAGSSRATLPACNGRDTFVGCMISDRDEPRRLDAALQVATIEYRMRPDGMPIRRSSRYMSGYERHSVIVSDEFASQAVGYLVVPVTMPRSPDGLDWEGAQQWFMSRDRLVGLVSLRTLREASAAGVWGRLHLGMDRELETGEDNVFRYGGLIVRVHDHNLAGFVMRDSEAEPGIDARSRQLLLGDAHGMSGAEELRAYPAGEEHFYLVEVLPYWSELAEDVQMIDDAARGFSFAEADRHVLVLHNDSAEEIAWQGASRAASVTVHIPPAEIEGPRARLTMLNGNFAWPPDEVRVPPAEIAVVDGRFEVTIAPHSHVVVVSQR
jgi:hypothetical protein